MMIGQHKTFSRNDFTGTTTSEMHYSILQADAVRTIYFINADIQSHIIHGGRILFFQISQHPHPLVGMAGKGGEAEK